MVDWSKVPIAKLPDPDDVVAWLELTLRNPGSLDRFVIRPVELLLLLRPGRIIRLFGAPGSGKTAVAETLATWLANTASATDVPEYARRIQPVLVTPRTWAQLVKRLRVEGVRADSIAQPQSPLCLILDGFEQISGRNSRALMRRLVEECSADGSQSSMVITSRTRPLGPREDEIPAPGLKGDVVTCTIAPKPEWFNEHAFYDSWAPRMSADSAEMMSLLAGFEVHEKLWGEVLKNRSHRYPPWEAWFDAFLQRESGRKRGGRTSALSRAPQETLRTTTGRAQVFRRLCAAALRLLRLDGVDGDVTAALRRTRRPEDRGDAITACHLAALASGMGVLGAVGSKLAFRDKRLLAHLAGHALDLRGPFPAKLLAHRGGDRALIAFAARGGDVDEALALLLGVDVPGRSVRERRLDLELALEVMAARGSGAGRHLGATRSAVTWCLQHTRTDEGLERLVNRLTDFARGRRGLDGLAPGWEFLLHDVRPVQGMRTLGTVRDYLAQFADALEARKLIRPRTVTSGDRDEMRLQEALTELVDRTFVEPCSALVRDAGGFRFRDWFDRRTAAVAGFLDAALGRDDRPLAVMYCCTSSTAYGPARATPESVHFFDYWERERESGEKEKHARLTRRTALSGGELVPLRLGSFDVEVSHEADDQQLTRRLQAIFALPPGQRVVELALDLLEQPDSTRKELLATAAVLKCFRDGRGDVFPERFLRQLKASRSPILQRVLAVLLFERLRQGGDPLTCSEHLSELVRIAGTNAPPVTAEGSAAWAVFWKAWYGFLESERVRLGRTAHVSPVSQLVDAAFPLMGEGSRCTDNTGLVAETPGATAFLCISYLLRSDRLRHVFDRDPGAAEDLVRACRESAVRFESEMPARVLAEASRAVSVSPRVARGAVLRPLEKRLEAIERELGGAASDSDRRWLAHQRETLSYVLRCWEAAYPEQLRRSLPAGIPAAKGPTRPSGSHIARDLHEAACAGTGFELREGMACARATTWLAPVLDAVRKAAEKGRSLLILGETGTGKELVACAFHRFSKSRGALEVVDCTTLVGGDLAVSQLFGHERGAFTGATEARAGAFERAERGTVFLDEVGFLDLRLQPLLLRVLQERVVQRLGGAPQRVDVRVVAATDLKMAEARQQGRFLEPLYQRLGQTEVELPSVRARIAEDPGELLALLTCMLEKLRSPRSPADLTVEAWDALLSYNWPGNARDVEKLAMRIDDIERKGPIGPGDLGYFAGPVVRSQSEARSAAPPSVERLLDAVRAGTYAKNFPGVVKTGFLLVLLDTIEACEALWVDASGRRRKPHPAKWLASHTGTTVSYVYRISSEIRTGKRDATGAERPRPGARR